MNIAILGSQYARKLVFAMAIAPFIWVGLQILFFGFHSINHHTWWQLFGICVTFNILSAYWVYRRIVRIEQTLINVVKTKEEFYSMVTHDLKNPLAAILMATDLGMREKGDCSTEIELIARQAKSMLKMIDDLLCSQAARAGKLEIKVGCVLVSEVLKPILDTMSSTINKFGITIVSDVQDISCLCDTDRLSQILTNLLSNSIKHTPSGGYVEIKAKEEGDDILFVVSDSGVGISKDKLSDIFTAYETDRKLGGHGLGLSIVKSLVEAHHGKVWADSVIGRGTKLYFTIPQHTPG